MGWILRIVEFLFGRWLTHKQDVAKESGRLEQSNEQLKAAIEKKDEALNERLEVDDKARGESDAAALGRLR
jgi:cell shape-determining protein MreC